MHLMKIYFGLLLLSPIFEFGKFAENYYSNKNILTLAMVISKNNPIYLYRITPI